MSFASGEALRCGGDGRVRVAAAAGGKGPAISVDGDGAWHALQARRGYAAAKRGLEWGTRDSDGHGIRNICLI